MGGRDFQEKNNVFNGATYQLSDGSFENIIPYLKNPTPHFKVFL
jgi:hypothetical protein